LCSAQAYDKPGLTSRPGHPSKGGIEEGDFKTHRKQDVLPINTGAIFFTIEVEVYLCFVDRENRGRVLELFNSASGAVLGQIPLNPPLLKGELKKGISRRTGNKMCSL
jgi:hypothetical protein